MKAVYPACTVVWYSFFGQLSCSGTCSTCARSLIDEPRFEPNMLDIQVVQSFFWVIRASLTLYLKLTLFFLRFFFILLRIFSLLLYFLSAAPSSRNITLLGYCLAKLVAGKFWLFSTNSLTDMRSGRFSSRSWRIRCWWKIFSSAEESSSSSLYSMF